MRETMTMEAYEAPMVEVIEVEVEMGFAASADIDDINTIDRWGN